MFYETNEEAFEILVKTTFLYWENLKKTDIEIQPDEDYDVICLYAKSPYNKKKVHVGSSLNEKGETNLYEKTNCPYDKLLESFKYAAYLAIYRMFDLSIIKHPNLKNGYIHECKKAGLFRGILKDYENHIFSSLVETVKEPRLKYNPLNNDGFQMTPFNSNIHYKNYLTQINSITNMWQIIVSATLENGRYDKPFNDAVEGLCALIFKKLSVEIKTINK